MLYKGRLEQNVRQHFAITRAAIGFCLCLLVLSGPVTASAQSRAEIIAQEQAQKAADYHPSVPPKAERIFLSIKKQFLDSPNGFYPMLGSIYPGNGLTGGGGFRRFYGDRTFWDAKLLWSV